MPTTITSAGITFNDATTLTSANIGTAQIADGAVNTAEIANGAVTAVKLGTTEQTRIAKAWVNFNGTTSPGTIRSSYNVSSVTKNANGDYNVNFATPMADANYSVSSSTTSGTRSGFFSGGFLNPLTLSVNSCRVENLLDGGGGATAYADSTIIGVQVFGN